MNPNRQITSWGHIDWLQTESQEGIAQTNIGIVSLLPGMRQAEHTHYSENQFLYMLDGHGEHWIDGKRVEFHPGSHFFLPCGIKHSTTNLGSVPVKELLFSVPVHLSSSPQEASGLSSASPDDTWIQTALRSGLEKLAADTLDHLNVPLLITDTAGTVLYGRLLSETCSGCVELDCPLRGSSHELNLRNENDSGSVVCPRGLTVLIQPVEAENRTWYYIKSGLFHEYPNVPKSGSVYDVPGSTVSSIRILLQDIARYLHNFYRAQLVEREFASRISESAEERSRKQAIADAFEQAGNNTLNIQIRNHFLFNTLNTIASLAVRDNSMDTYTAILDLSELLRGLLRKEGSRVPLSEELLFLRRYISLQELRHEDSLEVTWKHSSSAERIIVPHNFLQPVAENSFVHGFKDARGIKQLSIETFLREGRVHIVLQDNGCGMTAEQLCAVRASLSSNSLHGLSMVYRKLAGVFGMDFTFEIDSTPGAGTVYHLTFPC